MSRSWKDGFFGALRDETGGQTIKSAIGVTFFLAFVATGALINSASLPLSYNIAFGDSGNGSEGGSGSGGGGGGGGGGGIYAPRTKARIDYVRIAVAYEGSSAPGQTGIASNDTSSGRTGWFIPENSLKEDGNYAIAEIPFGETTYYLRTTNLGLSVPKAARITGVTLEMGRSADGQDPIRDYSIRLIKNGQIGGTERAQPGSWTSNDTKAVYGGEKDLWGMQISPDEANASGFGFAVAARSGSVEARQAETQTIAGATSQTQPIPAAYGSSQPYATDDIGMLMAIAPQEKLGSNVKRLQEILIARNLGPKARELAKYGPTGKYGNATYGAILEFKKSQPATSVARTMETQPMPELLPSAPASQASAGIPGNAYAYGQQAPVPSPAASSDPLATLRSLPTPLGRGDAGDAVRKLSQLLIRWNIGPDARELGRRGETGAYGWPMERAVAELQNALMKNPKGPAARKLIEAFEAYKFGKGTFGEATKAAEIEFLSG